MNVAYLVIPFWFALSLLLTACGGGGGGGGNDPPVIDQGGPLVVTMSKNEAPTAFVAPTITASDADGDSLNWSGSSASSGNANVSGTGTSPTITYVPNLDFTGADSFVVTVDDGNNGSDTITIEVTVELTAAVWNQFSWDDGSAWK